MSPRALAWATRLALWLASTALLALVLSSGLGRFMDAALYDLNMRYWGYTPGDDIVIVAIDPKSLAALGHWPWPRALHAQLIDRLTDAGAQRIGLDVTTSTPDRAHPENDRALATALHRNGHVVVPVFAEANDLGGTLEETLPPPQLAKAVAAFGHVDVPSGADGITRGTYLMAGLGQAYWPSMALRLYQMGQAGKPHAQRPLPGLRNPYPGHPSPYVWVRDHYALLRYAGPEGRFGRVSYVDVLQGHVPRRMLHDRTVLIGATAKGMGDAIRTPVGLMPGVEYLANILQSLRRHLLITPLGFSGQFALGALLLALATLLPAVPVLRQPWRMALISMLAPLLLSLLLLRAAGYWWPPAACVLAAALLSATHGWLARTGPGT